MTTTNNKKAATVEDYLVSLKKSRKFGPQVVFEKLFEATTPKYFDNFQILSPELQQCLKKIGINKLYSHQGKALESIEQCKNVMIATPTSSGKSMVYNLPVLNKILSSKTSHALYLFPLKALSQDQLKTIKALADNINFRGGRFDGNIAAIYDGDTSAYQRRKIREKTPPVIITNPEMLHLSFLPFHENWSHFFRNLDFVVIDEVHTYRGVFGSHIAWLIRRLNRVLRLYGKKPTYILSSATIGNPEEFAVDLTGYEIEVLTKSGAPQSRKSFLFLNPWDSAAYTASQLLEASLKRGLRTIVYTQSRKMTELISLWTKPRLGEFAEKLSSYRAGFLPEERRNIETRLSDGSLLGVISTSALELGIDIGDLDICILVGYPGSIMASWQRGGRVGRGGRESAVILIGSEDALDQYYMKNPEVFFSKEVESAVLNPQNKKIMGEHLHCAAAEYPLNAGEELLQHNYVKETVHRLTQKSVLLQSADGNDFFASRKRPQRNVSLRGSGTTLTIINGDSGLILGEIDSTRALKECHEGAIYLHKVNTWFVEKLDLFQQEVIVVEKKVSFYTKPMSSKNTEILSVEKKSEVFGCPLFFGNLKVREKVTGFQKKSNRTNKLITTIPLELPEQIMETEGFWLEIPKGVVNILEDNQYHFMGGLHAFEHVMISVFPLLVLCDRNDVGGISCPHHEQTNGATIFIYDGHPGGSGLSREAFAKAESLIKRSYEIVGSCQCDTGCPSCVHSPKCGSGNRPIDKESCLQLISKIIKLKNNRNDIPAEYTSENNIIPPYHLHSHKEAQQLKNNNKIKSGVEVLPEHYGVFDLETKYSAEEVGGWHRADKMEVSVGVVYDSILDGYVTYMEDEIDRLIEHLQSLQLVIGFNNKRFDNRVLSFYTKNDLSCLPTLDLLEEVKNQLGYRLSLNGIAEHTLGKKKTGDGLQALKWYKEGEIEKICKYCRKDVEITKNLLIFALENHFFLFQNKAGRKVRLPIGLAKPISDQLKKDPHCY